jgi:exonuclease SbcD
MGIKIFHTADVHLGMKFARGYAPEVQSALIEARFETLACMVRTANEKGCSAFVVAGDLFDNQRVPKKDVLRAADSLRRFEGSLVLVLPGNHDYVQKAEDSLWVGFRGAMGERTLLLEEAKPYDLREYDLDMIAYAAPCTAKHSKANAIGWIKESRRSLHAGFHVGIAHGSLEGLSPDFNEDYYPMTVDELEAAELDLWLMGHTHVRRPDRDAGTEDRILFPSTPEPDGFDCRHPGYAWLVEIDADKEVRYQSLETGRYHFLVVDQELRGEGDVLSLKNLFEELDPETYLVKLRLSGRVPSEIYDRRGDLVESLRSRALHVEEDLSKLYRAITAQDIDREFTQGSFPHRLLTALAERQKNPLSLQMAYEFIRKARP